MALPIPFQPHRFRAAAPAYVAGRSPRCATLAAEVVVAAVPGALTKFATDGVPTELIGSRALIATRQEVS